MNESEARTFALVGPGRAGTTIALALVRRGWRPVAVAGRDVRAPSTKAAAARFLCPPSELSRVGRGAQVIVIATPDTAIGDVAGAVGPGVDPGALVVHLSGVRGLDALAPIAGARPDVRVGALHPLQTFAAPDATRLAGAWAAVAGPPAVTELAVELGLRPFVVDDERRARYHAAAVVASNHVVALLGQVARIADDAGVPFDAFVPLVRAALDHVEAHGPAAALTGPVARGDAATVVAHLEALPPEERETYRALARAAAVLAGRDDPAMRELLNGVTL